MAKKTGDYETGYRKPPKHTRFQKGVSGNPKGRPKGAKSIATILNEMSREQVKTTINGRTRYKSKLEIVFLQLINKAAGGDLKAIREYLSAHRLYAETEAGQEKQTEVHERDTQVMKSILRRVHQQKSGGGSGEEGQ